MEQQTLFGLYLVNLTLLILHEMDSTYWKEWELFRLPGGLPGFLWIHLPLFLAGLYGLVLVDRGAAAGLVLSLVVSAAGIFAFALHSYFLAKGRPGFDTLSSRLILWLLLLGCMAQGALTIRIMTLCPG
jgi:hypothetical protein